jgi:hypothetical protein
MRAIGFQSRFNASLLVLRLPAIAANTHDTRDGQKQPSQFGDRFTAPVAAAPNAQPQKLKRVSDAGRLNSYFY